MGQEEPSRDIPSFRWDQLTGESSMPRDFNYLTLWQYLVWSKIQEVDRAAIIPSGLKFSTEALNWTKWIKINEGACIGGGSFGDAFMGVWHNIPEDIGPMPQIVVKVMRLGPLDPESAAKRYKLIQREIVVWNSVEHENIVPFIGICYARGPECPALVSPWMENRDIMFYLRQHPNIDRETMLLGIARGIEFLHGRKIIHGDIKGANILVNKRGQPCLIDFGISRMISDRTLWHTSSTHAPGSTRWQAPELMDGTEELVTFEGDVYSFGMTCLEVMTDCIPFREYRNDIMILNIVVMQQQTPKKPTNVKIKARLWNMWNECWLRPANRRPTMTSLVGELTVAEFLMNLKYSALIDIQGFHILFFLYAGLPEAAFEVIVNDDKYRQMVPIDLLHVWSQLPTNILTQLIFNQCRSSTPFHTALMDASKSGSEDKVRRVLNSPRAVNEEGQGYEKSLILASRKEYHNIVRLLLKHSARPNTINSAWEDTIANALTRGCVDAVNILLGYCDNGKHKRTICSNALLDASHKGNNELVKLLIEHGADTAAKDNYGRTSLHLAARNGHVEVMKLLIEHGADIAVKDNDNWTALHRAANNGHVEVIKLLEEHGMDIKAKDKYGRTSLHLAARNGHVEGMKLLIKHDVDIEAKDNYGWTAFALAASNGYVKVMKLLKEHGVDIAATDDYGR